MICLADRVTVRAPASMVAAWLRRMPEHYKEWHPKDHLALKTQSGESELHEGSIVRAAERLAGFTLVFTFKVSHLVADREVHWRALWPYSLVNLHGKFVLEERDDATEVTATSCYGWPVPLLGRLLDWTVDRLFLKKSAIAKHMREEGKYMKAAIEAEAGGHP